MKTRPKGVKRSLNHKCHGLARGYLLNFPPIIIGGIKGEGLVDSLSLTSFTAEAGCVKIDHSKEVS
jgi:hypothetical protein